MPRAIRRATIGLAVSVLATGCGGAVPTAGASRSVSAAGETPTTGPRTTGMPTASAGSTAIPTASSSAAASPSPSLPDGTPSSYGRDVPAGDVPLRPLVPAGSRPDGAWYASTAQGDAIVVAFAFPSNDPFRRALGYVVWRRFPDAPPWRPVLGRSIPATGGVLAIQGVTADVTGDGSDDVLLAEATGGSGSCARWVVLDPSSGAQVFARPLCDGRIDPSASPIGLRVTGSVYHPGDAHCCPSATRTTELTYAGDGHWRVASRVVRPNGPSD